MLSEVYQRAKKFKRKYPLTIAWRMKAHSKVIDKHLDEGEKVIYAFAAQKNENSLEFFRTYIVALTSKRIMIAQKRVFFGYFLTSITPDLFNDLKIKTGLIWGMVKIDTVKELVIFSNIQKQGLQEIETVVTNYMMKEKRKYFRNGKKEEKNI